jgi:hypothetical protein
MPIRTVTVDVRRPGVSLQVLAALVADRNCAVAGAATKAASQAASMRPADEASSIRKTSQAAGKCTNRNDTRTHGADKHVRTKSAHKVRRVGPGSAGDSPPGIRQHLTHGQGLRSTEHGQVAGRVCRCAQGWKRQVLREGSPPAAQERSMLQAFVSASFEFVAPTNKLTKHGNYFTCAVMCSAHWCSHRVFAVTSVWGKSVWGTSK